MPDAVVEDRHQQKLSLATWGGRALILFGLLAVSSTVFSSQRINRVRSHEQNTLNISFEELAIASISDRLVSWERIIDAASVDPQEACSESKSYVPPNTFIAFESDGRQVCGPALDEDTDALGRWVPQSSGNLVRLRRTYTGSVLGLGLSGEDALPQMLHNHTPTLRLVGLSRVLASANASEVGMPLESLEREAYFVSRDIPGADLTLHIVEPYKLPGTGFHLQVLRYVGLLLIVTGAFLRMRAPWIYWWRCKGPPDGVSLFVVNRKGLLLSWSCKSPVSTSENDLHQVVQLEGIPVVQSLINRASSGEVGATDLFTVANGKRLRFLVVGWSNILRRGVILVSEPYTDPWIKIATANGNAATATVLDENGLITRMYGPHFDTLMVEGNPLCSIFSELFDERISERIEVMRQLAINEDGRVVDQVLPLRWKSLHIFMLGDSRRTCFVWIIDRTDARLGQTLMSFIDTVLQYVENPVARRPDMVQLRNMIDLEGTPLSSDEQSVSIARRPGAQHLITQLDTLLDIAESGKFGSESPAAMRFRAARRREVARIIHDNIMQDLIALRWKLDADQAASELCDQITTKVRVLVQKLRTPPWQTQMNSMLESFIQPVKDRGIAVTLHNTVEEPLENSILSVFVVVAKESITNASKHAAPTEIGVDVRTVDRELVLTVSDDGLQHESAGGASDTSGTGQHAGPNESSGVGLLQCEEMARQLNGRFMFETFTNGHVVTLVLPLSDPRRKGKVQTPLEGEFDFMYEPATTVQD